MDDWNCKCRIDLDKIILLKKHKEILRDHAEKEKPNESCALLFGKNNKISEIYLTKNTEESSIKFTISNEELIKAYKISEEKDMEIIGIFHSHPNSEAYPSNTDKKFMLSNPVVWMIYSNRNNNFKAFTLNSEIKEIGIQEH